MDSPVVTQHSSSITTYELGVYSGIIGAVYHSTTAYDLARHPITNIFWQIESQPTMRRLKKGWSLLDHDE
ncbi:hypothetical protein PROFUN_13911 [Planoprotostelium fungivorum]|uniref:Uncharacterized protein n=1 Tax=Planoprotostelium fungivorum TaxID=1890364 RepID=A0A2P6N2V1_9EUKA|nr:hypothetical protein PROFUN_13911 [Planoprotostelium fungivorum]